MKWPLRLREYFDLNPGCRDRPEVEGLLQAANWLNEQSDLNRVGYLVGDVMLLKFNLINKRQLRKHPRAEKAQ